MKFHGIDLQEGSAVKNMTVVSGPSFPPSPNDGELFFLDTPGVDKGLFLYSSNNWNRIGVNGGNTNVNIAQHASRHLPDGADALTTGTAVGLSATTINGAGTANSFARSDHTHQITGFQPSSAELTAISSQTGTGVVVRTGTGSWNTREFTAGSTKISITNGTGVTGNPTIDVAESNLSLPNIGGVLPTNKGGTGLTGTGGANTLLGVGGTGNVLEYKAILGGSGISIVHSANSITINSAATGSVTSASVVTANGFAGTVATPNSTPAITISTTVNGLLKGNGTAISAAVAGTDYLTTLSGDVTTSGNTATLATVNSSPVTASFSKVTTNGKGLVTATSPVTLTDLVNAVGSQTAKTVLAAPLGAAGVPSFRTISHADLSDTVITSPSANQVLTYNGTNWINKALPSNSAASGLISTWTLSGNTYYSDFVHNLGTTNVLVSVYDTTDNTLVGMESVKILDTNTIRLVSAVNTASVRVVAVANGSAVSTSPTTINGITVSRNGVDISTASKLNFAGYGFSVATASSGVVDVTVGSRYTYYPASLDAPNTSDWAINNNAPMVTDPSNVSLAVRQFSSTAEQGIGFFVTVPPGATNLVIRMRGKSDVAQASASQLQFRLYRRMIPENTAMGAWSSAYDLPILAVPANAFFQYYTMTVPVATLNMSTDKMYQVELTRNVTVAGNLATTFGLIEVTVEFN